MTTSFFFPFFSVFKKIYHVSFIFNRSKNKNQNYKYHSTPTEKNPIINKTLKSNEDDATKTKRRTSEWREEWTEKQRKEIKNRDRRKNLNTCISFLTTSLPRMWSNTACRNWSPIMVSLSLSRCQMRTRESSMAVADTWEGEKMHKKNRLVMVV